MLIKRSSGGPDAKFSMEPAEFKAMVRAIRSAEAALGDGRLGPAPSETPSRAFRRSLFIVQDVEKGEKLTADNLRAIRPGNGLPPREFDAALGRRAKKPIKRGTPLSWDLVTRSKS